MKAMIKVIIVINLIVYAAEAGLTPLQVDEIATAIYKIEGGANSKYPYGVKSVNTLGDKDLARRITINSLNNSYKRWNKTTKQIDFLTYFSLRWCPLSDKADTRGLNKNWLKNVKYYIKFEID